MRFKHWETSKKPIAPKSISDRVKVIFLFLSLLFTAPLLARQDSAAVDSTTAEVTVLEEDVEEKDFYGPNDSTRILQRSFDSLTVEKLKADPRFNYKQPPTVAESLWDRFWQWVIDVISSLFRGATSTDLGQVLLYTGAIILIIVLIMLLLKVDALKVFYSGADQGKIKQELFHENIHEMDFEKLIREATEKGDYRLGVRLIFLYALKMLSDQHLIDWQAGKTNHDYVDEVKTGEVKTGLNELSFYFDYAWYGGFPVDQQVFNKVDGIFKTWKGTVGR